MYFQTHKDLLFFNLERKNKEQQQQNIFFRYLLDREKVKKHLLK